MNDREKTKLLTKIGFLYLEKMGCHEISTEIVVHLVGKNTITPNDGNHYIIDILGLEWEYLPPLPDDKYKTNKKEISRGIEIKVSRVDFKNGFVHHGCNFNYILVPKGLIQPDEVHTDVGIIELDIENFSIGLEKLPFRGYILNGINLIRKPKRKECPDWLLDSIRSQIPETLTNQVKRWIKDEFLSQKHNQNL
jgi:hypothetical protein